MKACAAEDVCDARLAHGGAEDLETPDEVVDELWKPVHGFRHPYERIGSFFVETRCPRGDRECRDEEPRRSLRLRPAAGRTQLEGGEALDGRVVWAPMRRDLFHPGVIDATLLSEEQDLVAEALVLLLEADASVDAVGGDTPSMGEGRLRKRNRVDDSRTNAPLGQPFGRGMSGPRGTEGMAVASEGPELGGQTVE